MNASVLPRHMAMVPFNERSFAATIKRAARWGDRTFITAPGGSLSFAELPDEVARSAGLLAEAGVMIGGRVALLLSNRLEFVLAWWGTIWAGGVAGLIHPEFKGPILARTLANLAPEVVVTETAMLDRLAQIPHALATVKTVLVVAEEGEHLPNLPGNVTTRRWSEARQATREIGPAPRHVTDDATIMLTSGTTGPSKAVRKSQHFEFVYSVLAAEGIGLDETCCIWSASPCTHVRTANCAIYASLIVGAQVAIGSRFSASRFWEDMKAAGATHTYMSNWMANLLMKQPELDSDRESGVRVIHCMPPPSDPIGFAARFGVGLTGQGYGSTEAYPLPQQLKMQDWTRPAGFLGLPHRLMETMVADHCGFAVPRDGRTVGEILVRPRIPHAIFSGYFNDVEATAIAFRDLWFHTGDSATIDADGNLYFVGRISDAIRRRGENISAWEIEQLALTYPGVAEAAAYGVADRFGEQEVKLDLVPDPQGSPDPAAVIDFLAVQLPRFMVPRYVEIRSELPRTPTGRVEKYVLRRLPLTEAAFDREAAPRPALRRSA